MRNQKSKIEKIESNSTHLIAVFFFVLFQFVYIHVLNMDTVYMPCMHHGNSFGVRMFQITFDVVREARRRLWNNGSESCCVMCMCMWLCMCVHVHLCVFFLWVYIYIYMCVYIYIYTYIHTNIHTCIHTYKCVPGMMLPLVVMCRYSHTYIHTCIHTYIHTYTCIHTHIHTYTVGCRE